MTLKGGEEGSVDQLEELRNHVAVKIRPIAKPANIVFTPELPKTRSRKIMRRLLRDVAEHRALGNTTTLADPAVVRRSPTAPWRSRPRTSQAVSRIRAESADRRHDAIDVVRRRRPVRHRDAEKAVPRHVVPPSLRPCRRLGSRARGVAVSSSSPMPDEHLVQDDVVHDLDLVEQPSFSANRTARSQHRSHECRDS